MNVFLPRFLIFSLFCAVLLWLYNTNSAPEFHDSVSWYILGFFSAATLLVHYLLLKAANGPNPKDFVYRFMGLTGIKLFAYLVFLIVMFFLKRDHARMIALYFLCTYLVFTTFEILSLYKRLKTKD